MTARRVIPGPSRAVLVLFILVAIATPAHGEVLKARLCACLQAISAP